MSGFFIFLKKAFICLSCKETVIEEPYPLDHQNDYILALSNQLDTLLDLNKEKGIVVSLKGPWGVGKTFFWNKYTKSKDKSVKYITVSLFGKHRVNDIREEILLKSSAVHKTIATLKKLTSSTFVNGIDLGALVSLLDKQAFKDIVICFDDFERISQNLDISEVLGFIAELKEQYSCKIIIINNNEMLKEQDNLNHKKYFLESESGEPKIKYKINQTNNHEVFEKYSEKIIDVSLCYEPHLNTIFDFLKNENIDKKYIDWVLIETLFNSIADPNKRFNIRLISEFLLKLELIDKFLADESIRNEVRESVVVKIFEEIIEQPVSDEFERKGYIKLNLNKRFYSDIVKKHNVDICFLINAARQACLDLEDKEKSEEELEKNTEKRNKLNEIYFNYMYGMSFNSKDFVNEFYDLLRSSENVVSLIGIETLHYYLKDFLIVLDKTGKSKYEKFYIDSIKEHIVRVSSLLTDLSFLQNYSLPGMNLAIDLNSFFESLKNESVDTNVSLKDKIESILDEIIDRSAWDKNKEIELASIARADHEALLVSDRYYFEKVFDFMRWVNAFSGDKPFKEFYDLTCGIYLKLAEQSETQHRMSFILKRLGL